jgi:hypothetical protein
MGADGIRKAELMRVSMKVLAFLRKHIEIIGIVPALLGLLSLAWLATWYRGLPAIEVGPILCLDEA